jgi:hypothetical protein
MQQAQALENPHFKKIWEEVNWKIRHPKAKSLEEALKFERKEPLSLLVAYSWPREQTFTSVEYDIRDCYNGMARVERVLGRPINLEDIILLFPTNSTHFIKNANSLLQIKIFGIDKVGCDFFQGVFDWQLGKPLDEQSPETWEKINKLINK